MGNRKHGTGDEGRKEVKRGEKEEGEETNEREMKGGE